MDAVAWGGGGAGGGAATPGGTGGSRAEKLGVPVTGGATLSVVVGAGGTGVGQVPTTAAGASSVEISAGNRLTAAGGANFPTYTGAASGGTGVFASPTLATGTAGGAPSTVTFSAAGLDWDFDTDGPGGTGGTPDGGAGGAFIDENEDGVPETLVPAQRPGGGGATTPFYRTLGSVPVNTGGNAGGGAPGRVILTFYP